MHVRHVFGGAALAVAGVLALTGPASAHIHPSVTSAPAGSSLKFELRVGHGCGDTGHTTRLEVQIPEGITSVTPEVAPGWTIATTVEQLPEPIEAAHGDPITERTSVVTWTGGPLDHHELQEFGLSVRLPDTPGETLYFPAIQTCHDGTTAEWIQIAEDGAEEPESPAPAITLTAAIDDGLGADEPEDEDPSTIEGEEAAPSTDDDSSDSRDSSDSDGVAIAGLAAGAVGLIVGGIALLRTRKEG